MVEKSAMTGSLILRAYGRTVELSGPDEAMAWALERLPPEYEQAVGTPERRWAITKTDSGIWIPTADGQALLGYDDPDAALEAALSDLELWIAEHADDGVFVHAGCVAFDGRAIVLPGSTHSGKTTLTRALLDAGAVYLSDEYAIVDGDGRVRPYVRPLSLRDATGRVRRLRVHTQPTASSASVALIAFLSYDASVDDLDVTPLSRSETVLQILMHTVPAQARPKDSLRAATAAARGAVGVMGARGDAGAAAALLISVLERG
jgi:hypothetical protein